MNDRGTEKLVLDWVTRATFDPGNGCQHSILTIALGVERSERQVARCIKTLEAAGDLHVERAPRGSRRCNTYRVRAWSPSLRSRIVERCSQIRPERDRIRVLRQAKWQSKRTAARSGLYRPGKDNRSNVVNQRCGRESNRTEPRFQRSRGVPEPARALRLVDCPHCEKYRRMVDALEVDLENAETSLRAERRQKNEAKAEARRWKTAREKAARETPNIELIERLWEFHREHVRPKNRKIDLKTIEAVRDRLSDTLAESEEPAYTPRYVAEAILGAKYEAFVSSNGKRHDQLELICRDPKHLEDFHERWERRQHPRFAR